MKLQQMFEVVQDGCANLIMVENQIVSVTTMLLLQQLQLVDIVHCHRHRNFAPSIADEPGKSPHAEIARRNLLDFFLKKAFQPTTVVGRIHFTLVMHRL